MKYAREANLTYRRTQVDVPASRFAHSRDVNTLVRQLIGSRMQESFLVLALTTRHTLVGYHEVGRGSTDSCPVDLPSVLRYPLLAGAPALILAHNHPSGVVEPSGSDDAITWAIGKAAKVIGLQVLDHVITCESGAYYSYLDNGRL